jgi:hypothetical protein
MRHLFLLVLAAFLSTGVYAQKSEDKVRSKGYPKIPNLTNANIPGAPILSQPMLITGTEQEIRTEKHGLAYPAFYDWNYDGKVDLLLGEFETGKTGSNVKVYLNEGTNKKPKYSGKYFYARDVKGDTITNHQWCCIGIHPRFVDLDKDGYVDILSGQYNPGLISWWRGSKDGFLPRQFVPQEGYDEKKIGFGGIRNQLDPRSDQYWVYTSAGFGDFNGDGLMDLFVGGFGELRVALNEGTKDAPKYGLRKNLLGLDGLPLSVIKPDEKALELARKEYRLPNCSGVIKSFVTPVDWDGDGVLDLLVTHAYGNPLSKDPVTFFRGVQTDKGLRFEDAKPLFTAEEAKKTFPGCQPNITVTDYNHDGIPDLVFGISIPTVNGYEIDSLAAWGYISNLGIEYPGKDAGRGLEWAGGLDKLKKKIEEQPTLKSYYLGKFTDYKYLTLRHRGYVYVMLGKRNPVKAEAKKGVIAKDEVKPPVNETIKSSNADGLVTFSVKVPGCVNTTSESTAEVTLNIKDGWHAYTNAEANVAMGFIPTEVKFEFPDGFKLLGEATHPIPKPKGTFQVYEGDGLKFCQKFRDGQTKDGKFLKPGEYTISAIINYQVCNEEMCLPPVTEKVEMKVNFNF